MNQWVIISDLEIASLVKAKHLLQKIRNCR